MIKGLLRFREVSLCAVLLILPLTILLPGLGGFPYPPAPGAYSDLVITHYPNALFLRRAILEFKTIPLWSDMILSGYPFAANPLSGLWYPPGWLTILLPLPLAMNLLVFLHLFWGGLGLFLLLRREGLSAGAALFGAMAFEAMPKLFAHYGAGHLTLLYAIPWTPWLLLATYLDCDSKQNSGKNQRWWKALQSPAVIWGIILLADVRWGAYATGVWWAYAMFQGLRSSQKPARKIVVGQALQTIQGLMLAAPLLLPLWEYVSLSTREQMTAAEQLIYSLPPARLLGFLYPDLGGFHEWAIYSGVIVFPLVFLGIIRQKTSDALKFWFTLGVVALILSMAGHVPLLSHLFEAPGIRLLRVPARLGFVVGLSLAALAAHQLEWILAGISDLEKRRSGLALAGLTTFSLSVSLGAMALSQQPRIGFTLGSAFLICGVIWIRLYQQGILHKQAWVIGLFCLCLLDLSLVNRAFFRTRDKQAVLDEAGEIAEYLVRREGDFRVYSPSYSMPQQTAARYGLELANGVDPMQLESYVEFLAGASGVPRDGYSIVQPPIANGDPATANRQAIPDAKKLGLLNVEYVLAAYPISATGLELERTFSNQYLYKNSESRPRAWVQIGDDLSLDCTKPVFSISRQPNTIQVVAEGPGLLVLSEVIYPGWNAWVDGRRVRIEVLGGILRGVQLEPGTHRVTFRFLPVTLLAGIVLCGGGVGWLLRGRCTIG